MTKRIATAVAVLGAASIISGCGLTEQPSAGCIVQDSTFALWQAKYIVKEADAAKSCGQLKGEELGVWKYANPVATEAEKAESKAAKLAIRPRGAASLTRHTYSYKTTNASGEEVTKSVTVDRVPESEFVNATSLSATLPEKPDAEGFCKAGGFEKQTVAAAEVKHESTGETLKSAQTVEYHYENVEVYSHPSAPGTQLRGTLKYGDGNGCTAEYEVWALWPATPCVPGSSDSAETCGEGSGLNPDFDAVCDADLKRCVTARQPKSFKNQ